MAMRKKPLAAARTDTPATEVKIPVAMLVLGLLIEAVRSSSVGGAEGALGALLGTAAFTAISVLFSLGACFITAKIMGISFGFVGPACLKLAAIAVFPAAIAMLLPGFGWILAVVLYWSLLMWFFDLELVEAFVLVVVLRLMWWTAAGLAIMLLPGA